MINSRPRAMGWSPALVTEIVMTGMFIFIILGATDERGIVSHAGLTIGLALTLIHLISIPITNTSVNPARSTGPALALLTGGQGLATAQLWLFWLGPMAGATLASLIYRLFEAKKQATDLAYAKEHA